MEHTPAMHKVGACDHINEINVSDTPTQIILNTGKNSIEIRNNGENTIYYGGSGVSSNNGIPLYRGESKAWTHVKQTFNVYIVCANTESSKLRVVEYE